MRFLDKIVREVNDKSKNYNFGDLQYRRREIKGLSRLPSKTPFNHLANDEKWAMHCGGRTELQFNLGIEGNHLRYGIAFSLETSQTLPSIEPLISKMKLFNQFLKMNSGDFSDLKMWHRKSDCARSSDYEHKIIRKELFTEGYFIFLGGEKDKSKVRPSQILETFDRLLDLYLYVESDGSNVYLPIPAQNATNKSPFVFKSGYRETSPSTERKSTGKTTQTKGNHDKLKNRLYDEKIREHGKENVGTENPSGNGQFIDLVVKKGSEFYFYEIKTHDTDRLCIREAIGQLLEYSYWPGCKTAKRLVVAGKPELTEEGKKYLEKLRKKLNIPVYYEQITS